MTLAVSVRSWRPDGTGGDATVIRRVGGIATVEAVEVNLDIGKDVPRSHQSMILPDIRVTRGMSGGGAFVDTTPASLYGIISAHDPLLPEPSAFATLPPGAQLAAQAISEVIGPINAGLAYVVPAFRVRAFLWRCETENSSDVTGRFEDASTRWSSE